MNEADEREEQEYREFRHPRNWKRDDNGRRNTRTLKDGTECCYVLAGAGFRPEISNKDWGSETKCERSMPEAEAQEWLWNKHKEMYKEMLETRPNPAVSPACQTITPGP